MSAGSGWSGMEQITSLISLQGIQKQISSRGKFKYSSRHFKIIIMPQGNLVRVVQGPVIYLILVSWSSLI